MNIATEMRHNQSLNPNFEISQTKHMARLIESRNNALEFSTETRPVHRENGPDTQARHLLIIYRNDTQ
jgi:hypothetical protein